MKIITNFFNKYSYLKNKFLIVTVFFVFWILIFDENSLISQISSKKRLKKLKADKEFYLERIKTDSIRLDELKRNKKSLERFARENYYMKNPDEDVYVVVEKEE